MTVESIATAEPIQQSMPATEALRAQATPSEVTMATKISSFEELKKKAPKVSRAILEGIATNVITRIKHNQDRLKELQREWRRWSSGN